MRWDNSGKNGLYAPIRWSNQGVIQLLIRPCEKADNIIANDRRPLETVLRRDRRIVGGAIGIIVALAGPIALARQGHGHGRGMDMTGFRMIPAGIEIGLPASQPWRAIEIRQSCCLMWAVTMVGMMAPSAAPMIPHFTTPAWVPTGKAQGKPFTATGWFCRRLSPRLGRLFAGSNPSSQGDRAGGPAGFRTTIAKQSLSAIVTIAASSINGHCSRTFVSPNASRHFCS